VSNETFVAANKQRPRLKGRRSWSWSEEEVARPLRRLEGSATHSDAQGTPRTSLSRADRCVALCRVLFRPAAAMPKPTGPTLSLASAARGRVPLENEAGSCHGHSGALPSWHGALFAKQATWWRKEKSSTERGQLAWHKPPVVYLLSTATRRIEGDLCGKYTNIQWISYYIFNLNHFVVPSICKCDDYDMGGYMCIFEEVWCCLLRMSSRR